MRKEYGKALRSQFEKRLFAEYPDFRLSVERLGLPGSRTYVRHRKVGFSSFVSLTIKDSDRFTVEIGWGDDGKLPIKVPFPDLISRPLPDKIMFRLSKLWMREDWWLVIDGPTTVDQAVEEVRTAIKEINAGKYHEKDPAAGLARIPALLDEVFAKLRLYAEPIFDEAAAEYTARNTG